MTTLSKRRKSTFVFLLNNIKIDPNYLARLRNASKRDIKITIVFGVDNGDDRLLQELLNMPNCTVYFKEYLHAKFYYNEKELLVGSMNLSEASAKNNFELGVLFKGDEYTAVIKKVKEEAKEIISDATKWTDLKNQSKPSDLMFASKAVPFVSKDKNKGSCIRCNMKIPFNAGKPLCIDCFHEWAEWENEDYSETYCHNCGKEKDDISFAKPECYPCYQSSIVRL